MLTRPQLLRRIIPTGSETALAREWRKLPETLDKAPDYKGNARKQLADSVYRELMQRGPSLARYIAKRLNVEVKNVSNALCDLRRQGKATSTRWQGKTIWTGVKK